MKINMENFTGFAIEYVEITTYPHYKEERYLELYSTDKEITKRITEIKKQDNIKELIRYKIYNGISEYRRKAKLKNLYGTIHNKQ